MSINKTWLTLALLSGGSFATIALLQFFVPSVVRVLDVPIAMLLAPFQTFLVVETFLTITALGDVAGIIAIAIGSTVFMRNHPHYIRMLALALLGSTLVANTVKVFVARARPDTLLWLNPFLSFSFPSGHATASMTLFAFLAVAAYQLMQKGCVRSITILLLVLATLLVGVSRLLLGAHFLSDVVGGWLLGFTWVAIVFSFTSLKHR